VGTQAFVRAGTPQGCLFFPELAAPNPFTNIIIKSLEFPMLLIQYYFLILISDNPTSYFIKQVNNIIV